MKHYDSFGPNPRALRMFLTEKGISIGNHTEVDILKGENRQPPYAEKNPAAQVPALELDNGLFLAETGAIFEYLEEKHPTPALIGTTPEERAETRMWLRRIELGITETIFNSFRFGEGLDMFKDRFRCLPEAAEGLKLIVQDKLQWLDPLLAGKKWICGDRFTICDISLYCALDFIGSVGRTVDPSLKNVTAWKSRVADRPSAAKSLHPAVEQIRMAG